MPERPRTCVKFLDDGKKSRWVGGGNRVSAVRTFSLFCCVGGPVAAAAERETTKDDHADPELSVPRP
ncbi:hypothetical protein GWI33_017554 [Rhynchophorus ferrugineus]|uniref:Uncharacterized protein n=1 Tax=Rhynchophorus ferrugineus TaxID=354439 RepID=A0A834HVV4_RHYFE|nr:hypothetical protein GWI33_017554 [Rhynchophorus ferrugineus]